MFSWRRYSIIPTFFVLIAVVAWWAHRVESSIRAAESQPAQQSMVDGADAQLALTEQRRELLEVLDRTVAYEFYYRSVYGHFTKLLHRVGLAIPEQVRDTYDIRVVEASSHRLLITAISEGEGRSVDLISIDQNYRINANFGLPAPRREYLQAQALKHLRTLEDLPQSQSLEESGIYKGYFRFDVSRDVQGSKSVVAFGIKAPVLGVQVAALKKGRSAEELLELGSLAVWSSASTGQKPLGNVMSTQEEAMLAQKIFRGETGRYAKDWAELAHIAAFRFKDRKSLPLSSLASLATLSDSGVSEVPILGELDLSKSHAKPSHVRDLAGEVAAPGLIVEPISRDSNR